MTDRERRLAQLAPERQLQLVKLLKARAAARQPAPPAGVSDPVSEAALLLDASGPREHSEIKTSWKQFYDSVSTQLDASVFGQFSFFLNYGYVADSSPEYAVVELPDRFINKNSVKLVLEVIGDCPVDGRRVLDVGCGRGGTIFTLKTFFKPAALTGLDLSTTAIAFDRKAHGDARTTFHEGDAEDLPFPDGSFDIVTNVESSHSYPKIHRFYSEVRRVLGPGGYFLYTDVFPVQQIATSLAYLDHVGFELLRNRDITNNVLLSSDEIAATRVQAFDDRNDQQLMHDFLATPGSRVYEELRSGRWEYRIWTLRVRA